MIIMDELEVWHNPRCGKSRATLALIEVAGYKPIIRLYLKDTPSYVEIQSVLNKLNILPLALIRINEPIFVELFKDKKLTDTEFIQAMVDNPILIERPIVINKYKAVLGRPPENVLQLIK